MIIYSCTRIVSCIDVFGYKYEFILHFYKLVNSFYIWFRVKMANCVCKSHYVNSEDDNKK